MNESLCEQLFSYSPDPWPKPARQTHGSDLAEASHSNHFVVSSRVSPYVQVPLRVTDNGDHPPCYHLEENFLSPTGYPLKRELEEETFPAVTNRRHLLPVQLAKGLFTETDIGTRKDSHFGFRICDLRFGSLDSGLLKRTFRVSEFGLKILKSKLDQGNLQFLDFSEDS